MARAGRGWAALGALVLATATSVTAAGAQEGGEDFYRHQTIRIVVNAAGGGFDGSAEGAGPPPGPAHPGKLRGGGRHHVRRRRAGWRPTTSTEVAKPDGLTIAHFSGDLLLGEVLGRPGDRVRRPEVRVTWGPDLTEHIACAFSRASGITSIDRWMAARTPVKLGGTAPGSNGDNATRILKAVLGLPIQLVSGYKGTAAIRLAVDSGELAGACFNWSLHANRLAAPRWTAARWSSCSSWPRGLSPTCPAVPLVTELAPRPMRRDGSWPRPSCGRAGWRARMPCPRERRRDARAAPPPGISRDAPRSRVPRRGREGEELEVNPTRGEDVERLVGELFTMDPPTVARLRAILFD